MKLLITGGCGFLGSNLAAHALERGDELIVFDNLSRLGATANLAWLQAQGHFTFVHGDIRNTNDVDNVVRNNVPDAIFHLAGQVAMTTSIQNPRMDFEINVLGTYNLLEAVRLHTPETAVVYSSTNKVYGDLEQYTYQQTDTRYICVEHPDGFDETTQLDFRSPYGCSKGAADQYMLDYARIFDLNTVVFRHSSMYGGRQYATYDQGWVGWFCQQALLTQQGKLDTPFTISGNGKQVRDVLHAEDMQRLYFSSLEHREAVKGRAFNIGGGIDNSLSLLELFNLLEQEIKCTLEYTQLAPRISDQKVFVADIAKISRLIGWNPAVGTHDGILKMLQWLK